MTSTRGQQPNTEGQEPQQPQEPNPAGGSPAGDGTQPAEPPME